jgi:hypothetical protein
MREKFYGLLKEYLVAIRERDICEGQFRAAPEGIEREQVSLRLKSTRKRCVALLRQIRCYPDINTLPHASTPNNSRQRRQAQAS